MKRHLNPIQKRLAKVFGKPTLTINGQSFDISDLAENETEPLVQEIMQVCQLTAEDLRKLSQGLLDKIREAKAGQS